MSNNWNQLIKWWSTIYEVIQNEVNRIKFNDSELCLYAEQSGLQKVCFIFYS